VRLGRSGMAWCRAEGIIRESRGPVWDDREGVCSWLATFGQADAGRVALGVALGVAGGQVA
jgi:hypothetical protein